jgi:hypothetical protein
VILAGPSSVKTSFAATPKVLLLTAARGMVPADLTPADVYSRWNNKKFKVFDWPLAICR